MTVEHFITRFVYQFKEISLQGIGIIRLDDVVPEPDYLQKHKALPITNLHFTYKPGATTTPEFVKFYSDMRGKILSLAENDVEAYLGMALQFLNIGNPVDIKGLGTISKQKDGTFVMSAGHFLPIKEEDMSNRFRERAAEQEETGSGNFYGQREPQSSGLSKLLIAVVVFAIVAVGGWWLYQGFLKPSDTPATPAGDTLSVPQQVVMPAAPDTSLPAAAAIAPVDSTRIQQWKAIFREESGKDKALQVWANYRKLASPITMETADSVQFTYYVILESSLQDTARKRDSLARFFARPVKLQPLQ